MLSLITATTGNPVTWDEMKADLRLDTDDERTRIESDLVPDAVRTVENTCGRQLLTATYLLWLPCFPSWRIRVPRPPLQSVTWVKYRDTSNVLQTLDAANYLVVNPAGPDALPASIEPAAGLAWPSTYYRPDAVEVKFVCGYGAGPENVPAGLRAAVRAGVMRAFDRHDENVPDPAHLALRFLVEA